MATGCHSRVIRVLHGGLRPLALRPCLSTGLPLRHFLFLLPCFNSLAVLLQWFVEKTLTSCLLSCSLTLSCRPPYLLPQIIYAPMRCMYRALNREPHMMIPSFLQYTISRKTSRKSAVKICGNPWKCTNLFLLFIAYEYAI